MRWIRASASSDGVEPASELRQLGGSVRRAAAGCLAGRVLQLRGDTLIRPVGGEREMTRPLLLVDHDRGQPAVDIPPCLRRGLRVRHGRKQRVSRPDAPAAPFDDAGLEGILDVVFGRRTADRSCDQ